MTDVFGKYDAAIGDKENAARGVLGPARGQQAKDNKAALNRLEAQHAKETAKLEARVARLEQGRKEVAEERDALKAEVDKLKKQSSASRLTLCCVQRANLIAHALVGTDTMRHDSLEKELEHLRVRDQQAAHLSASLASSDATKLAYMRAHVAHARAAERTQKEREAEVYELKVDGFKRQRELGDRKAQVEWLVLLVREEQRRAASLEEALQDADDRLEHSRREAAMDRQQCAMAGNEVKEWRRRWKLERREVLRLLGELEELEALREIDATANALKDEEYEQECKAWAQERVDKEVAEGELELAISDEIPRLEDEVEGLEQRCEEQESEIEVLRDRLDELEDVLARLRDEREIEQGENEELRRLHEDATAERDRERTERKRTFELLARARAGEQSLADELKAANEALAVIPRMSNENASLKAQVDLLERLQRASDEEVKQLTVANAELASHDNPRQKIRHIERVRDELTDTRKVRPSPSPQRGNADEASQNLMAAMSKLARTEHDKQELLDELDTYRAVDTRPTSRALRLAARHARSVPASHGARGTFQRVEQPVLDELWEELANERANIEENDEDDVAAPLPEIAHRTSHGAAANGRRATRDFTKSEGLSSSLLDTSSSLLTSTAPPAAMMASRGRPSSGGIRMHGPMTLSELF